jgi:hypothetical protein
MVRSRFFLILTCSLLLGVGLGTATAPLAQADCAVFLKNVTGREKDGTHRGILTQNPGMWIAATHPETCTRVSTLDQYVSNGQQAELGWMMGYSSASSHCGYPSNGGGKPYRLAVVTIANVQVCPANPPALTPSTDDYFRFQDDDADGVWSFVEGGGTAFWTYNVGWTYGWAMVNGERHASGDSAFSEFQGLQKDTATGWTSWAFADHCYDSDGTFDLSIPASPHLKVINTGSGIIYTTC